MRPHLHRPGRHRQARQPPQLDAALAYLRDGDTFIITRLSRAMRSLRHLIELTDELQRRRIELVVLKQGTGTRTPQGGRLPHPRRDRRVPPRTVAEITDAVGVHRTTVHEYLKRETVKA